MQNGMYYKYFSGKLISALVVDSNDMVFVEIGKIVSTENMSMNELVYVGTWKERPTATINAIQNELMGIYSETMKDRFLSKRKGKRPPKAVWNCIREKWSIKIASKVISEDAINQFCYGDMWFYAKKTQLPVNYFKDMSGRMLTDIEKYPAGFARWLTEKYYFTNLFKNTSDQSIWDSLISSSPKNIRKVKWITNELNEGTITNIRTNSKWDFYCSLTVLPELKPIQVKTYYEASTIQKQLGKYKHAAYAINDYINWYARTQNNGIIPKISMRIVQEAREWHKNGCPNREDVGNAIMIRNSLSPDSLEAYRIKTAQQMVDLGNECHHCIGSKWRSDMNHQFYTTANEDRSSVVCAEVSFYNDKPTINQCFDKFNETTEESKAFAALLTKELKIEEITYHTQDLEIVF